MLFCTYFGLIALPASIDTLCCFAQCLSRTFKSVQSIRNYVSGVKLLHILHDMPFPVNRIEIKLLLRGLERMKQHCPKQALPITPSILLEFLHFLDLELPGHAVYWCLFLFAFYLMSRKSNLVPMSYDSAHKVIKRRDVFIQDSVIVIVFHWSKTIQFGERKLKIPLLAIPGNPLCPVAAYNRMLRLVPASGSQPLFSVYHAGVPVPITYGNLQSFLRKLISRTGRDPSSFSSHSFRRGGATFAFQSKVPINLIQLHGDWRSDAYKEYLTFTLEDKATVFNRMSNKILTSIQ